MDSDEREAWRPRIFYSSGPDQGKPETFPTPTYLHSYIQLMKPMVHQENVKVVFWSLSLEPAISLSH